MADIKARREARIRKILDNSESRLKRIVNSNSDISEGEKLGCQLDFNNSDSHNETSSDDVNGQPEFSNGIESFQDEIIRNYLSIGTSQPENQRVNSDTQTIYQNPVPDSNSVSELEFQNFEERSVLLRNWVIIFLALVVRYLFLISEQYAQIIDVLVKYNMNNIFIPFFIFEITEFMLFRPCIPQSGVLNMLFMLNMNLQREYVHKIITAFRIISRVMHDLMIYIFTFVCFDQVLNFILQEQQIDDVPQQ